MGARTYRTFKQLLRASKTRRHRKPRGTVASATQGTVASATQAKKKTRRVKRRPFFLGATGSLGGTAATGSLGAAQKKQKGGAPPLSGESTVVARSPEDDEETPFTLQSAASYTASLPT
jgi:hypothetical protein